MNSCQDVFADHAHLPTLTFSVPFIYRSTCSTQWPLRWRKKRAPQPYPLTTQTKTKKNSKLKTTTFKTLTLTTDFDKCVAKASLPMKHPSEKPCETGRCLR